MADVAYLAFAGQLDETPGAFDQLRGMAVLNLWGAATAGAGRLPDVAELRRQLADAGFRHVEVRRLIPGDAYYAFVAQ